MTHLAPEIRITILGVFATLVVATLAAFALQKIKPQSDHRQIASRIRTWWLIVGSFIAALAWSPKAVIVFFALVSFLALKEFLTMTPTRRADRRVLLYAYLSIIAQYYFAAVGWRSLFLSFIPVIMFIWLPTRMWMIGQTQGFLRAAGTLHWAMMITVFCLSHAAYLLVLPIGTEPRVTPEFASETAEKFPGPGLLLFLILASELNSISQQIWGKRFGRRQIAPTVSPRKTYAGLICGVLATLVFAALMGPILTPMDSRISLLGGVIIAVAGFAGDLCMSALKRDLKIDDFGATLPGHGGVLDHIDSLLFAAPLFFYFIDNCYGQ